MSSALVFGWLTPLMCWILAAGFLFTWWRWTHNQYVLAVCTGYFLIGCGFVISHTTREWSVLPHFLATQIIYFFGLMAIASAFSMRLHKAPTISAMIAVSFVTIVLSSFLQHTGLYPNERLAVTNLGQGMIFALVAWNIRPKLLSQRSNIDIFLYWLVVLTAAQFLMRLIIYYLTEGTIQTEELRVSMYWAVLNATVIALSLLIAVGFALGIVNDTMDKVAEEHGGPTLGQSNGKRIDVNSILTKEELDMLTEP